MNGNVESIIELILSTLSWIVCGVCLANCIINHSGRTILTTVAIFMIALSWTTRLAIDIINRGK